MSLRVALVIDGDASGAKKAAGDAAQALGQLGAASSGATGALSGVAAANNNVAAKTGLAYRQFGLINGIIRSTVDTVALGVPPTAELALVLERLALSAGEEGAGAVFARLQTTLASVLTPTNLMIGAFAAVAGGSYLLYQNIKQTEIEFGALSERTDATLQSLHALESAASFKGIDTSEFIKGMQQFGTLTDQAKDGIGSLATLFRANGVAAGGLNNNILRAADLIRNAASEEQKYQLLAQLGLPQTRQWVQLLSQGSDGLRQASQGAVQFGGDADKNLIDKAREFDESWNTGWHNFVTYAKGAFVDASQGLSTFDYKAGQWVRAGINAVLPGATTPTRSSALASIGAGFGNRLDQTSADAFYKATGAGSGAATVDPAVLQKTLDLEQRRIGVLGQLATIEQTVRASEIQIQQARLAGVAVSAQDETRITSYSAAQALGTLAIRQQADAARIEAGAVGLGTGATAAFRAEQERLAEFRQRGIPLTQAQTAAIHAEALALGEATQAAALAKAQSDAAFARDQIGRSADQQQIATQLRSLYGDNYQQYWNGQVAGALQFNASLQTLHDTGLGFFQDLNSNLRQGTQLFPALEAAGLNALNKLSDKMLEMAYNNLFSAAFGGGAGGGGGLLGLLGIGGAGAPLSLAAPASAGSAVVNAGTIGGTAGILPPLLAAGGALGADRWAVVGERGFELMRTHAGGGATVYSNEHSRALLAHGLPGFAAGGGFDRLGHVVGPPTLAPGRGSSAAPIAVTLGDTHITVQGNADKETLKLMAEQLAERDRALPQLIVRTVADAKGRGVDGL